MSKKPFISITIYLVILTAIFIWLWDIGYKLYKATEKMEQTITRIERVIK